MLHVVNKLVFETVCGDESQAFEVRHNLSRVCQQYAAEIIEKVCTKYVGDDEWLQIERLEINLGRMNPVAFENDLKTALYSNFETEFLARLNSLPAHQRMASKKLSSFELLVFFLRKGILPWWAEGSEFDLDKICHEVLKEQEDSFHRFLQENRYNEAVWQRISMQFAPDVMNKIVYLFNELVTAERSMLQWDSTTLFRKSASSLIDKETRLLAIKKFILSKAHVLLNQDLRTDTSLAAELFKELAKEIYPEDTVTGLSNPDTDFENTKMKENTGRNENVSPADIQTGTSQEIIKDRTVAEHGELPKMEIDNNEQVEKFMVRHAGIILLSPFFQTLFSELGLWAANEWKESTSRNKAIHILRYLGTGEHMSPEYNLGLEKLLCGVRIGEPVPRDVLLAENEISEAEILLQSAIANWKALKNSSVHAMREAFIKRDGIVTLKEDGWLLQVEKKTEDVLLESIPWGYSTISFPWNRYIIYVEW